MKKGKQIKVVVDKEHYEILKRKAKELGIELQHYAGLVLSGYKIERT